MGLLLSVLIGCAGVLELLVCARQVSDTIFMTNSPPTPCLYYHPPSEPNLSMHDSICSFTHSGDAEFPESVKHKLENLHEYSLRVRNELKALDPNFDISTLSECSTRDLLSRAESRLSCEADLILPRDDEALNENVPELSLQIDEDVRNIYCPRDEGYVRVPTPIPVDLEDELSRSSSSSELDNLSGSDLSVRGRGDKLATIPSNHYDSSSESSPVEFVDKILSPVGLVKPTSISRSRDRSPAKSDERLHKIHVPGQTRREFYVDVAESTLKIPVVQKKVIKSTSIINRKPTRLKSKNSEVSKSAENLSTAQKSKRKREPERRRSDISVQTTAGLFKDESTNTTPPESDLSRSASRSTISVQVQTCFNEGSRDEKRTDGKRNGCSVPGKVDKETEVEKQDEKARPFRISSFEKAKSQDYGIVKGIIGHKNETNLSDKGSSCRRQESESMDEYVDADDEGSAPIEYVIPDTDSSKAFWLIFSGEYTKAMNKDWHSGHFCCWQCDESLTGQRYVLRDEHPYCIKCYESVFANGCEECNKIIGIDSKDLSYKDKHWHEACFLCHKCRVSLVDKQFGSKVDKIYCGNCYDAQFASRCDGCGEIFRAGTKKMEYKTRQWHEKCFCCCVCKNPIGTKSFIPREQEIYCAGCYEDKFATRCIKCNKIITSGGVTYKNEPWHRDCFTCTNCDMSLAGQRFTSRDDKPYCADCFGELFAKRCTACSKPITGIGGTRFISFEDRHWHNDCFICAGCSTSLVGRGFITDADDIICPDCAKSKLS